MALSSIPQDGASPMAQRKEEAAQRAAGARQGLIERTGTDLMNAWNQDKTDPSDMAVLGHDTATGYEFCIERDGAVITVSLARDLESGS